MSNLTRRAFLGGAAALTASALRAETQTTKTRLILLGTGGGPRPRKANSGSAQVIIRNNSAYVIDCGDGVARQLVLAGVPLPTLRHIFLTHQHSDHNADYGNLIWLAWAAGLGTRVDTWGPPALEKMTKLFFEMNAYDINTRIANEGRVPLVPLVHVHELREGGLVMRDDNLTVSSTLVDHRPSNRHSPIASTPPTDQSSSLATPLHRRISSSSRGVPTCSSIRCSTCRRSIAWSLEYRTRPLSKRASSRIRPQRKMPAASPRPPPSRRSSCRTLFRRTIRKSPTRCGWTPRASTSAGQ